MRGDRAIEYEVATLRLLFFNRVFVFVTTEAEGNCGMAQMVARVTHDHKVDSSSLSPATRFLVKQGMNMVPGCISILAGFLKKVITRINTRLHFFIWQAFVRNPGCVSTQTGNF